jgi:hypothetical protein
MDYYLTGAHRDAAKTLWHQSAAARYFEKDAVIRLDEAMQLGQMHHVLVEKVPTYINTPSGDLIETGDHKLAIQDPHWQSTPVLFNRTVGNRYVPMQNARLAELLEGLNIHWPVEGVMMLKNGEVSVVQLKIDEFAVGNREEERHLAYLVVAIDYTKGGLMWLRTDIRVVCWNTYSASIETLDKIYIPNSEKADDTLAFISKVQELTVEEQKRHEEDLNALFTRKVTTEEAATIVEAAFPAPKESSRMKIAQLDAAQKVADHDKELAKNFFEMVQADQKNYDWKDERNAKLRVDVGANAAQFNREHAYAADTAYAWFQSVTNTINHSDHFTGSDDKRAISRVLGNHKNVQNNAMEAALTLVGRERTPKRKKK